MENVKASSMFELCGGFKSIRRLQKGAPAMPQLPLDLNLSRSKGVGQVIKGPTNGLVPCARQRAFAQRENPKRG